MHDLTLIILAGQWKTLVEQDFSMPGRTRGNKFLFISYGQANDLATAIEDLTGAKYILDGLHDIAGLSHVLYKERSCIAAIGSYLSHDKQELELSKNTEVLVKLRSEIDKITTVEPTRSFIEDLLDNLILQKEAVKAKFINDTVLQ